MRGHGGTEDPPASFRSRCPSCGGTSFVDTTDNFGHSYRGCASCTVVGKSAIDRLVEARNLTYRLRDAKSTHAWTNEECALLAELCNVLGVGELRPPPRRDSSTLTQRQRMVLGVLEADGAREWTKEELFMRCRHEMTRVQLGTTLTQLRIARRAVLAASNRWQLAKE